MIEQLIAEATECDFKVALEIKKPKSWLKSVSSFSNGIGGTLFFGISDDRKPIGLSDVQKDSEAISRLIKERITPLPQFGYEKSRLVRSSSRRSHSCAKSTSPCMALISCLFATFFLIRLFMVYPPANR